MSQPRFWLVSDRGLVRDANEDAYLWLGPGETAGHGHLFVVADGAGGAGRGDRAVALLVGAFRDVYPARIREVAPRAALAACIDEANRRIAATVAADPALAGMATTVTAAAVVEGVAHLAHVGDGRAYLLADRRLERLTVDHTRAAEAVADGRLSSEQAEVHPDAAVLTRVLAGAPVEPDLVGPVELGRGTLLLCTDGVHRVIGDETLREAMRRLPAREGVEALIELSRRLWSEDNLTVGLVRMHDPDLAAWTTRDAFLGWAEGGTLQADEKQTMVLSALGVGSAFEPPPPTNVVEAPTLPSTGAQQGRYARTQILSADMLVGAPTGSRPHTPAEPVEAVGVVEPGSMESPILSTPGGTLLLSASSLAAAVEEARVAARSGAPGLPARGAGLAEGEVLRHSTEPHAAVTEDSTSINLAPRAARAPGFTAPPVASTAEHEPLLPAAEMDRIRAAAAAEAAARPAEGIHTGTMLLSPDQLREAGRRAGLDRERGGEAPPGPSRAAGTEGIEAPDFRPSPPRWVVFALVVVVIVVAGLVLSRLRG